MKDKDSQFIDVKFATTVRLRYGYQIICFLIFNYSREVLDYQR